MFGMNPIRGSIIQYLIDHPGGHTSGSIQRSLKTSYHTVLRHLQGLEDAGIVNSDGGENRQGVRVLYSADKLAIVQALADLDEYFRVGYSSKQKPSP